MGARVLDTAEATTRASESGRPGEGADMANRLQVERGTIIHFAKWTLAILVVLSLAWLALTASRQRNGSLPGQGSPCCSSVVARANFEATAFIRLLDDLTDIHVKVS